MGIQDHTGNTVIVDLPPEPRMTEELETVITMVRHRAERDVVLDFTNVGIVTSLSLSRLLQLRKIMRDSGRGLILRHMAPITRGIFSTVAFDELFQCCDGTDESGDAGLDSEPNT